jgi:hypothetical protein
MGRMGGPQEVGFLIYSFLWDTRKFPSCIMLWLTANSILSVVMKMEILHWSLPPKMVSDYWWMAHWIYCAARFIDIPWSLVVVAGHTAVARLLIEKGADPNAVNNKQNASLHYSISYGFADMTRFLIASGADEFATNLEGMTCYEGLTREDLDKL